MSLTRPVSRLCSGDCLKLPDPTPLSGAAVPKLSTLHPEAHRLPSSCAWNTRSPGTGLDPAAQDTKPPKRSPGSVAPLAEPPTSAMTTAPVWTWPDPSPITRCQEGAPQPRTSPAGGGGRGGEMPYWLGSAPSDAASPRVAGRSRAVRALAGGGQVASGAGTSASFPWRDPVGSLGL